MAADGAPPARGLFKTNYAVSRKIEPFFKGGKIQISSDGRHMFCVCGSKLNVVDVATGAVEQRLEQEDQEDITAFVLSPDDEVLVTGSRALLLTQWAWRQAQRTRTWRAVHSAPVASMAFDPTTTLLATGGCDGSVKLWDVVRQHGTHNLCGSPGVVHLVAFHPDISRLQLFSSAMDYKIRLWDLRSATCVAVLEGHYSAVTSLAFGPDGDTMISSGRDKICTVWNLKTRQTERTIPVFESVETAVLLPEGPDFSALGVKNRGLHFLTAGSRGLLRVWAASSGACVHRQERGPGLPADDGGGEAEAGRSLTQCALVPAAGLVAAVTAEHNILLYDAPTLRLQKQFAGHNDEVLDVRFLGPDDSHIVVATNSPQLKVFELATSACQILYGHADTVLALEVFRKGRLFASCGKDRSVRLWKLGKAGAVSCVAVGTGHTHGVGTVCCSRMQESFVVTGSQDCTVKLWPLPKISGAGSGSGFLSLQARATQRAHDKDINSVAVSPNDKLLATGSQDHLAKLWTLPDLTLLGVLSGHRRGIWCVQFSPMDQVLATASADSCVKLWALQDLACLKTFEGHDASVLKVTFVSRGTQLLSSGSDGLLKLWTIKTDECVLTLDAHQDKVWGLHCNRKDNWALSGAGDACVVLWEDVTEVELAEKQAKQEEEILKQQELSNLLHEKRYLQALGLAISLDRPHTVLTVVTAILRDADGQEKLEKNIMRLRQDQKEAVLSFAVTWNTNSRNCHVAQAVLGVLLRHESPDRLLQYQGIRPAVEALLPYTDRHFQRLGRLLQAAMFVDFMWQSMRLASGPAVTDEPL
ncbi:transducin beta-like protein 3 [Tachyglossus aculeatus]|uniref:transducin beta-like protein 3 n=1 Tax=Tachyglossus aculeatus TaxID=9261 RepID=UPI0018F77679|nr:transducin beta-like protein 3 [Tachyglossus aculeatus]